MGRKLNILLALLGLAGCGGNAEPPKIPELPPPIEINVKKDPVLKEKPKLEEVVLETEEPKPAIIETVEKKEEAKPEKKEWRNQILFCPETYHPQTTKTHFQRCPVSNLKLLLVNSEDIYLRATVNGNNWILRKCENLSEIIVRKEKRTMIFNDMDNNGDYETVCFFDSDKNHLPRYDRVIIELEEIVNLFKIKQNRKLQKDMTKLLSNLDLNQYKNLIPKIIKREQKHTQGVVEFPSLSNLRMVPANLKYVIDEFSKEQIKDSRPDFQGIHYFAEKADTSISFTANNTENTYSLTVFANNSRVEYTFSTESGVNVDISLLHHLDSHPGSHLKAEIKRKDGKTSIEKISLKSAAALMEFLDPIFNAFKEVYERDRVK
jgi:hypothetical protein